jgi:hypothetical protein
MRSNDQAASVLTRSGDRRGLVNLDAHRGTRRFQLNTKIGKTPPGSLTNSGSCGMPTPKESRFHHSHQNLQDRDGTSLKNASTNGLHIRSFHAAEPTGPLGEAARTTPRRRTPRVAYFQPRIAVAGHLQSPEVIGLLTETYAFCRYSAAGIGDAAVTYRRM